MEGPFILGKSVVRRCGSPRARHEDVPSTPSMHRRVRASRSRASRWRGERQGRVILRNGGEGTWSPAKGPFVVPGEGPGLFGRRLYEFSPFLQFPKDVVQNPVDEGAGVRTPKSFSQVDGLIDGHLGRDVRAVKHLEKGDPQDVPVHDGHAFDAPVFGGGDNEVVDFRFSGGNPFDEQLSKRTGRGGHVKFEIVRPLRQKFVVEAYGFLGEGAWQTSTW